MKTCVVGCSVASSMCHVFFVVSLVRAAPPYPVHSLERVCVCVCHCEFGGRAWQIANTGINGQARSLSFNIRYRIFILFTNNQIKSNYKSFLIFYFISFSLWSPFQHFFANLFLFWWSLIVPNLWASTSDPPSEDAKQIYCEIREILTMPKWLPHPKNVCTQTSFCKWISSHHASSREHTHGKKDFRNEKDKKQK